MGGPRQERLNPLGGRGFIRQNWPVHSYPCLYEVPGLRSSYLGSGRGHPQSHCWHGECTGLRCPHCVCTAGRVKEQTSNIIDLLSGVLGYDIYH